MTRFPLPQWHQAGPWVAPVAVFLVVIAALVLYYPGLSGPFLLDDYANLKMSRLQDFSFESLYAMASAAGAKVVERPLSFLTFTANFALTGGDEFYFKAVNLAIHLLIGCLLYILGQQLLRLLAPQRPLGQRQALAAVAAAFWLVEPMHVSTVLYIVQRMAQLSALFVTIAMIAYLGLRQAVLERARNRAIGYAVAFVVATLLGLASKQDAILVPAYVVAIEIAAHFTPQAALRDRGTAAVAAVAGIVPVVLGALAAIGLHDFILSTYDKRHFDLEQRVATELRVLWEYVRQLTIPRLSLFGLYNDDMRLTDFTDAWTYVALAGWLVTVGIGFALRYRAPLVLFGVLWFLAAHALESSIIGLEIYFEHRNYLAAFGITMILAELVTRWRTRRLRLAGGAIAVVLGALFVFQTAARVSTWSDYVTLHRVAVVEHPDSPRARVNYASVLFNNGRVDEGMEQLRLGKKAAPHDAGFELSILNQSCKNGRYREALYADAIEAVRTEQITPYAITSLGGFQRLVVKGKCKALDKRHVLAMLNAALTEIEGRAPDRYISNIEALRGGILANKFHNYEKALAAFRRSAEIYPRWASHWKGRIRLNLRLGNVEQARAVLEEMHQRFPILPPLTPEEVEKFRKKINEVEQTHARSATPPSERK